eukprot:scaffold348_cov329-Pavlova_lutheri.AAC.34
MPAKGWLASMVMASSVIEVMRAVIPLDNCTTLPTSKPSGADSFGTSATRSDLGLPYALSGPTCNMRLSPACRPITASSNPAMTFPPPTTKSSGSRSREVSNTDPSSNLPIVSPSIPRCPCDSPTCIPPSQEAFRVDRAAQHDVPRPGLSLFATHRSRNRPFRHLLVPWLLHVRPGSVSWPHVPVPSSQRPSPSSSAPSFFAISHEGMRRSEHDVERFVRARNVPGGNPRTLGHDPTRMNEIAQRPRRYMLQLEKNRVEGIIRRG